LDPIMPRIRFTNVRYALAVPMALLGAAATGVGATLETGSAPWSVGGGLLALAIAVPILVEGRHHERGVWIDGRHEVFAGPEQRLNAVIVREHRGRITVHGTCNAVPYEVTIPFPPGAEKEAQDVARRIRRG